MSPNPADPLVCHRRRFDGCLQAIVAQVAHRVPLLFQFLRFLEGLQLHPPTTHQKVGKESGETCHIERLNNTIRQRFSRMVRKTLSFSKKEYMLNLHFKLWAWHYNLFVAPLIAQKLETNY